MHTHISDQEIPYTGKELRSHWIMQQFGIRGDAIVAFVGPCDVPISSMVDLADVAAGEHIRARSMLHFIAEFFDTDLDKAILRQRLLVANAQALLSAAGADVLRTGDDLYCRDRKLSVSIATVSPVSTLIHFAINIDESGAPVPAIGLPELGVDPAPFAEALLGAFRDELDSARDARCKVAPVP